MRRERRWRVCLYLRRLNFLGGWHSCLPLLHLQERDATMCLRVLPLPLPKQWCSLGTAITTTLTKVIDIRQNRGRNEKDATYCTWRTFPKTTTLRTSWWHSSRTRAISSRSVATWLRAAQLSDLLRKKRPYDLSPPKRTSSTAYSYSIVSTRHRPSLLTTSSNES